MQRLTGTLRQYLLLYPLKKTTRRANVLNYSAICMAPGSQPMGGRRSTALYLVNWVLPRGLATPMSSGILKSRLVAVYMEMASHHRGPVIPWIGLNLKYPRNMKSLYLLDLGQGLQGRALNRVISWTEKGIEYEADPRQAEKLISECGMHGAKPVGTPGVKITFKEHDDDSELPVRLHTAFRSAAARSNYLAADRIDIMFGGKEICRSMAKPTDLSWKALKRLSRYLNGRPRLIYEYPYQDASKIDVYTDTDWAGCAKTRKSTSGGCILLGKHTIKHWSSTQPTISLSSGEAEFYGVVRGSGYGLGYKALLQDLGIDAQVRV